MYMAAGMNYKLLLIFVFISIRCAAQQSTCIFITDTFFHEKVVAYPDVLPSFPGGEAGLAKYLSYNLKPDYPEDENERYAFSTFLIFIIDEAGAISKMGIHRRKPEDYTYLDKAGLKVLSTMPCWKPARCNGKPVPTLFYLPIRF